MAPAVAANGPLQRWSTTEAFAAYGVTSTLPWAFVRTLGHRLLVPGGTGFEVLEVRPLEVAP